jgi:hypothetical protein
MAGKARTDPPRGELAPEVEAAARAISHEVWGEFYRPGHGPMHHAGGGYWHAELLHRAEEWEHFARAARICADALPTAVWSPPVASDPLGRIARRLRCRLLCPYCRYHREHCIHEWNALTQHQREVLVAGRLCDG